jgi:hypothetical protein
MQPLLFVDLKECIGSNVQKLLLVGDWDNRGGQRSDLG